MFRLLRPIQTEKVVEADPALHESCRQLDEVTASLEALARAHTRALEAASEKLQELEKLRAAFRAID